jgi:hypothetical protein
MRREKRHVETRESVCERERGEKRERRERERERETG